MKDNNSDFIKDLMAQADDFINDIKEQIQNLEEEK